MNRPHLLDRRVEGSWPALATDADVRALEAVPYAERIAASSTYEALQLGAAHDPQAPALLFLPNADPEEAPLQVTHREFLARVTQTANGLAALGIRHRFQCAHVGIGGEHGPAALEAAVEQMRSVHAVSWFDRRPIRPPASSIIEAGGTSASALT